MLKKLSLALCIAALAAVILPASALADGATAEGLMAADVANGGMGAQDDGAVDADVEPNDKSGDAKQIELDTLYRGSCSGSSSEYDFYQFFVPESGLLTVSASGTSEVRVVGCSMSGKESLTGHVTSGWYYLRITTKGAYTFKVSCTSAGESFPEGQGRNNDSIDAASEIELGASYRGQMAKNEDSDYYRFVLGESGQVWLSLRVSKRVSLELLDGSGVLVWKGDVTPDKSSDIDFSGGFSLVAGTYYLHFEKYSIVTGNYDFTTSFTSARESFAESQSRDNNTIGFADAVKLGRAYRGQIARNDLVDVYRFATSGSGIVRVSFSSNLSGVTLRLTDEYGSKLKSFKGSEGFELRHDCGVGNLRLFVEKDSAYGPYGFKVEEIPDIRKAKVAELSKVAYTGKQCKPSLKLTYKGRPLVFGADYTVEFEDNVNAGKGARMIVTGVGDFTGTKEIPFRIDRAEQPMRASGASLRLLDEDVADGRVEIPAKDACAVSGNIGAVRFKKVSANKLGDRFKVRSDGSIIVKKGTPKGAYKLKIRATAKGSSNYKPGAKDFVCNIKVYSISRAEATATMRSSYKNVLRQARSGKGVFADAYSRQWNHSWWNANYAMYDMGGNGVPELFVHAGYSDADTKWYAFTMKSGKLQYLGSFGTGQTSLYGGSGGKLYGIYEHMSTCIVSLVSLKGGSASEVTKVASTDDFYRHPKVDAFKSKNKLAYLTRNSAADAKVINAAKVKK